MPMTRSQVAEDKTLRVYEDSPASPSVQASAFASGTSHPVVRGPIATDLTTTGGPITTMPERRSRPPSVHSHRSTASAIARIRQAELEAEEQLAEIRRQELKLQATMIRKKLAANVATIREETDRESVGGEDAVDTNNRVNNWLKHVQIRGEDERVVPQEHSRRETITHANATRRAPSPEPVERELRETTPTRAKGHGIDRLADTLERMMRRRAPPRQTQDLPHFSGAAGEWLPFKAAMRESTSLHGFSSAENMARLRTCLKGEARQTVSALLFTAAEPSRIMQTLEQCYGRPEVIIDQAMGDMKQLPRVGTSATELNNFAIKLQNIVTVITSLDDKGYLMNPMMTRQVTEKLSPHLRSKWCDYAEEYVNGREPEILTLTSFLMREADRAVRHAYSPMTQPTVNARAATFNKQENRTRRPVERNRGANVYTTTESPSKKPTCYCCGAEHRTPRCSKLADMSVAQRWEWAKESRMCFQCLESKHRRFHCRNKRCDINECGLPHHVLLHENKNQENVTTQAEQVATATTSWQSDKRVLLKICPITIKGPMKVIRTYALFDEGSTVTLIDEEIAAEVGARGPTSSLNIHGVTSSQHEPCSQTVDIKIKGNDHQEYHRMKARTIKNLELGCQSIQTSLLNEEYLRPLRTEDVCYENAKPRVLIGADNWHLIVTRRLLTGKKNQPAASLTQLGWILHGTNMPPRKIISRDDESVLHIHVRPGTRPATASDDKLQGLVESHFAIDALGIAKVRKPTAKEERATEIIEATIKRVDGRYEIGLPWVSSDIKLPPSYEMASQRLRSIEKKMDRSPAFKEAYTEQIDALLKKGYAVQCEGHERDPKEWYLPHFAVTNPNKPGKIRMVFDAAARANNVCLNDVLLDGPDLLQALHGVLFRFREKPIAVTADIKEMFLRINIRKEDRVAQHFLWRGDDRRHPPQKYEMKSMIFGARSSPFIAHSVRNRNAMNYKTSHPLAFQAITRSHYMDDWVDSFDSEETAARAIREVTEVHSQAGFQLAGWGCNRPHLIGDVPDDRRAITPKKLGANANAFGKTLGLLWMQDTDQLAFNTAMHKVPEEVKCDLRAPTKREALSAVMSLFDPLGLISPYTITAKIMLQSLWKIKIGWDESIPEEEASTFNAWKTDLSNIGDLRLPRHYGLDDDVIDLQLHVFCDASEQAYATAAYWRVLKRDGSVTITLVAAKAKVTPIKAQTIPRLELQACLIGARLTANIMKEHRVKPKVTLWSDSKTALQWIRTESSRYTPYVAHRLSEITEITRTEQWRWVPTALNVADDATRMGNTRLTSNDRWFTGPPFLRQEERHWPIETESEAESPLEVLTVRATETVPVIDVRRFSSHERLVRSLGRALEAIDKWRKRTLRTTLYYIKKAELRLIQQAQLQSFPDDIARLTAGRPVARASKLYKLDPMYGEDGILRIHGRINAACVPTINKQPPILDGANPFSRLLIRAEHNKAHIGREQTVNNLRQKYWIIRLRPAVKSMINSCVICRARRAAPTVPTKGDLPGVRLSAFSRPFAKCGTDCFGPMWVRIGRRREKRWGMIFTCLVTRAIHLETVASLSTDSAIMALRRMAARRGWPQVIFSDNGTNFRGADKELENSYNEWLPALKDMANVKRVEWRFIDPGAPNQGGAWERLIRSVKSALAVTLNEQTPSEETLATTLAEIEHTINSRPLTHVSVDPDDAEALTPNHFLLGSAGGVPHVGDCDVGDKGAWRAAQALTNTFWQRWVNEYLPTLTPRGESKRTTNVEVGDLVIIADGLLPRNVWPRGQIEKVYTGPDGVVRSAEVRTRGGIFRRPVRRLIVLPTTQGCEDLRRGEIVTDDERQILGDT